MNLLRFLVVLVVLTVLGTVLGAASGALLGAAVPTAVTIQSDASGGDSLSRSDASGAVSVVGSANRHPVVAGAALGSGVGLKAGVGAGLLLGVFDQVLLALHDVAGKRAGNR